MNRWRAPVGLLFLVLGGCARSEPQPPSPAAGEKTLLIGLIPEQNIFEQRQRYEPLAQYLSERAGARIRLKVLVYYGNVIDNFESGGLDGAFFGSLGYALAHAKLGVSVVARPEDTNGVSTYHGLLFVRRDSGIRSIRDMKGKRLALVAKATAAGYLFPLKYFKSNGVDNYERYFGEVYFAGTHSDSVFDVLGGQADVGVTKNTVYERLAAQEKRIASELVVLARSPEMPENALALRQGIDPALRDRLKEALLRMHDDPQGRTVLGRFGAKRFIETTDADYQVVNEYAKDIQLDLAHYSFMNR